MTLRQRRPRIKLEDHLDFIRRLSCAVSGQRGNIHAAHIRYAEARYGKPITGMQTKPADMWCVPLHADLHMDKPGAQHRMNEREFWTNHGIDPCLLSLLLWAHTGDDVTCEQILLNGRRGLLRGCL